MATQRTDLVKRVLALTIGAALAACSAPTVSDEEELGRQAAQEIRRHAKVLYDDVVVTYVEDIGQRLVQAAGPQPFEYTFTVLEDDSLNASATFGGQIFVHTGLITLTRNVSELAGVLGHEVGHVVKRHVADNMARAQNAGLLRNAAVIGGMIGGVHPAITDAATGFGALGIMNTFKREAEEEADAFAVEVVPRAGYHPDGIANFFDVMSASGQTRVPTFFSSHPASAERSAATRALIAKVKLSEDLKVDDNGKLEIIQHRIRLLTKAREKRADDRLR
ncbi:MAG: M48 family metalloprotease [Deltaproteobacteria bacterium]|nr:M48 family metalloprotease [Deltaproteobacteria bacterium]